MESAVVEGNVEEKIRTDIEMLQSENEKARGNGGSDERVWMKLAIVEKELGNVEEERRLLAEGLKRFPSSFKLWLMLGQLEERSCHLEQAKKAYGSGSKHCPNCIPLWLSLANLEEKMNGPNEAQVILTMAREKNPQAPELWLAAIRTELRHENKGGAEHLMLKALQECLDSGNLWADDINMLQFENKDLERARMIQKERRLLKGDQLPPALLVNRKDDSLSALSVDDFIKIAAAFARVSPGNFTEHKCEVVKRKQAQRYEMKTCYKSSAGQEEDSVSSSEEERVFEDDSSSEDGFVSEEDDQEEIEYIGMIKYPSRSAALSVLPADYRKRLKRNVMEHIKEEDSKLCLGHERFVYVLETNPIPDSHYLSDSNGYTFQFWSTEGPDDKYMVDEQTRQILKVVGGPVRDQKGHSICWTYIDTDVISASRMLHGLDSEFVPLSPMFLCRNVCQEKYTKNCKTTDDEHCCSGSSIFSGLRYAKLHGVPREKPKEVIFDCRESKPFIAGDEELYKIKDIFCYDTIEAALERVKSGYPVAAGLLCFEGWNKHWKVKDGEMYIYNGPESGAKYVTHMHGVIIIDFTRIHGVKVAICKSSNGVEFGNGGYIAVNLEIMLILVGAAKKKGQLNWCSKKPQYLLEDFYSVDVEMGSQPLIKVDPDREREHMKYKVETDAYGAMLAPIYQNQLTNSAELVGELTSSTSCVPMEKPIEHSGGSRCPRFKEFLDPPLIEHESTFQTLVETSEELQHLSQDGAPDDSMLDGGSLNLKIHCWKSLEWAFVDGSTGYDRENPWGVVDVDGCCGGDKYLVSFGSAGGYTTLEALAFEDVIKAGTSLYGGMQIQEASRKFYDTFQRGKVYYISRGLLKLAYEQFKTVQNDYEMTLNENSEDEEAGNDNFVRIDEMGAYVNQEELIDVQSVSSTMSIRRRNGNEMIPKKDIALADEKKKTDVVSLWNKLATGVDQEMLDKYPVIATKPLKVGDFQGAPLSTITRSNVMINPDSPDAKLKYWHDCECKETFMSAIGVGMSSSGNNGSRSMYSDNGCHSHFTSNLSLGEEKPVYVSTTGYTSFTKPDQTMWNRACKTCNKKVTEAVLDSGYQCEGCQKKDKECRV